VTYEQIEKTTQSLKLGKLKSLNLFDVFESEKLGLGKKSMAVSFIFQDEEKTMTDKDTDALMTKITAAF
jgi:phenylalanyl-tRNA synthetase beta chain